MANNPFAEMLASKTEREEMERVEALKRKGHTFFQVKYVGNAPVKWEADGMASNIRMHGAIGVIALPVVDENNNIDWQPRVDAVDLKFKRSISGEAIADVLDDEDHLNRMFVSRNLYELSPGVNILDVVEPTMKEKILELAKTKKCPACKGAGTIGEDNVMCPECNGRKRVFVHKFRVELSPEERLVKEKQRIERQLAEINQKIEPKANPYDEDDEEEEDDDELGAATEPVAEPGEPVGQAATEPVAEPGEPVGQAAPEKPLAHVAKNRTASRRRKKTPVNKDGMPVFKLEEGNDGDNESNS